MKFGTVTHVDPFDRAGGQSYEILKIHVICGHRSERNRNNDSF